MSEACEKLEFNELIIGAEYYVVFKNGWRMVPTNLTLIEKHEEPQRVGFKGLNALYSMNDVDMYLTRNIGHIIGRNAL